MRAFTYHRPASLDDAVASLSRTDAYPLGGGTDLLPGIEDGVASPTSVVDLGSLRALAAIEILADGGIRIGASARIADVASHEQVREHFPVLADACSAVGTPALRNMGTLGGNLCQRPRCWYLRRAVPCLKNGGSECPAREGENQYHAILDGGPCYIVHPSDTAVALTALDAMVEISGSGGATRVPITQFYVLPRERLEHETVLRAGDVVSALVVPATFGRASGQPGRQYFRKIMQRGAWDFALVSIAAARADSGAVRIVLGGVAPRPWRVPESVEEDVASGGLDEDSIGALAERALYDAQPLSKNGYKLALAGTLLREAIRELSR